MKSRLQEQSPPARTDIEKLGIPLATECEALQLKLDSESQIKFPVRNGGLRPYRRGFNRQLL